MVKFFSQKTVQIRVLGLAYIVPDHLSSGNYHKNIIKRKIASFNQLKTAKVALDSLRHKLLGTQRPPVYRRSAGKPIIHFLDDSGGQDCFSGHFGIQDVFFQLEVLKWGHLNRSSCLSVIKGTEIISDNTLPLQKSLRSGEMSRQTRSSPRLASRRIHLIQKIG